MVNHSNDIHTHSSVIQDLKFIQDTARVNKMIIIVGDVTSCILLELYLTLDHHNPNFRAGKSHLMENKIDNVLVTLKFWRVRITFVAV
jgi:hypothetical protein